MTERLNVYLNGRMAGVLDRDNALDVFSFRYLTAYLDMDGAIPISRSLPLKDVPFGTLESRTFFENLLPPEVVRRRLEKILHHDYRNTFAFLKELGGDCAGAISLYPDGIEPGKGEDVLRELTEDEADDVLTSLPSRPLLQGKVEGYRISVAGAQDKLVARLRGGAILLPLYGAASTHIIKPQMAICSKVVLSPLYDLLSTAVYPNLSPRMAMSIGGVWEFSEVRLESFDTFAAKCDINPKFVRGRIDRMLSTFPAAMKDVAEELSDGGHHSPVFGKIIEFAQRHMDQLRTNDSWKL